MFTLIEKEVLKVILARNFTFTAIFFTSRCFSHVWLRFDVLEVLRFGISKMKILNERQVIYNDWRENMSLRKNQSALSHPAFFVLITYCSRLFCDPFSFSTEALFGDDTKLFTCSNLFNLGVPPLETVLASSLRIM